MENMYLVDTFVFVIVLSGLVNVVLKQQTSFEGIKKSFFSSDLKIDEGNYMQVKFLSFDSVDGVGVTQVYVYLESFEFICFLVSVALIYRIGFLSVEIGF